MKSLGAAAAGGALFGAGLLVSGMTRPEKVVGFLDVTGAWDPSLALVMAGAIAAHVVGRRLVQRRGAPLFGEHFHVPTRADLDPRLVAGAAIFGVGWGLSGYCPGPALVAAAGGVPPALLFVAAMTVGIVVHHALHGRAGVADDEAEAAPPQVTDCA